MLYSCSNEHSADESRMRYIDKLRKGAITCLNRIASLSRFLLSLISAYLFDEVDIRMIKKLDYTISLMCYDHFSSFVFVCEVYPKFPKTEQSF